MDEPKQTPNQMYQEAEQLKAAGKLNEAVQIYQKILQTDPNYVLAHHALAVAYCTLGDYDAAIQHALRACELEPNDPFAYMSLSVTYRKAFQGTQDYRYIQLAEDAMARSHQLHAGH
ncbi:MAG: nuclear scaffold-like protein p76 [Pirellulaceae bacterium]|nr:MAG: nuclear scaffold-like protein p76 [Pirellulaceae bacterium]